MKKGRRKKFLNGNEEDKAINFGAEREAEKTNSLAAD